MKKLKNRDFKREEDFLAAFAKNSESAENSTVALDLRPQSGIVSWLRQEARVEVIRFGMNAVKNVSGKAVDAILKVRNEHGQLKDFMEFMKKVNLNEVNRRMFETLVKCGAFDSLHDNRAQLAAAMDGAFHLAQEFQRAEDASQTSLFELLDSSDVKATETRLEFPQVKNWPKRERLNQEKAALGFYVSGHPLDSFSSEIKFLATTTSKLKDGAHSEKEKISLIGTVVNNIIRLNQNNEKYAIVTLEDMRGTIEFPVFANVYENTADLLERDEPLLVTGRVNHREDDVSLYAETIRPLSKIREEEASKMLIQFGPETFKQESMNLLRNILQKYAGNKTFSFSIQTPESTTVQITPEERVDFTPELIEELEEILPFQKLEFSYSASKIK